MEVAELAAPITRMERMGRRPFLEMLMGQQIFRRQAAMVVGLDLAGTVALPYLGLVDLVELAERLEMEGLEIFSPHS